MAADLNMGFQQGTVPYSFCNQHMVSFQSGAVNRTTETFSGGMSSPGLNSNIPGMFLPDNPSMTSNMPAISAAGSSSSKFRLDHVQRFKPGTVTGSDWSAQEMAKLNEGLRKYAHEPNFVKYIKIAAMLPGKTIRDVALTCHCMSNKESGKRQRPEEHYAGKKIKDTKGKMVVSSPMANIHKVPLDSVTPCSLMMHNVNHSDQFLHEGPAFDGEMQHLLDENVQILCQISANIASFKIQENIKLFLHTRNNFASILRRISGMPLMKNQVLGIMSPLPPLLLSINEELLKSVVSFNREPCSVLMKDAIYGAPSGMNS